MSLMFTANEITERNTALTYDDVLLMPRHCEITSRTIPNLETRLTKNKKIAMPFIAANMDTVTESEMAIAMAQAGGIGVIHRNMTVDQQTNEVDKVKRFESGLILDPVTVSKEITIGELREIKSNMDDDHHTDDMITDEGRKRK